MNEPIEIAQRDSGVFRISVRTAGIMLAFTLVFTAMMAGTYRATAPLVAASALAEKLRLIGEVLPAGRYDNDLMADAITLPPQKALGLDGDTRLWRARKDGAPSALVLEAAAPDGYSGRIGLILAVASCSPCASPPTRKLQDWATISTRKRIATRRGRGSPNSAISVSTTFHATNGA